MKQEEQIKIMKEALEEIQGYPGKLTATGETIEIAYKALNKAYPKKTMTLREAIEKGLDFRFDGDDYDINNHDHISGAVNIYCEKIDNWMPLKWILENQDEEVEILDD